MGTEIIDIEVRDRIFLIRGQRVMLDADLAELYGTETKKLNQAVKRNIERFPIDFMFQLNEIEKRELVTNCDRFRNLKHSSVCPYAFNENGIAMLSSILKSPQAISINIQIIRTFNKLRALSIEHADLRKELVNIKTAFFNYAKDNNLQIEEIFKQLDYLKDITKPGKVGF